MELENSIPVFNFEFRGFLVELENSVLPQVKLSFTSPVLASLSIGRQLCPRMNMRRAPSPFTYSMSVFRVLDPVPAVTGFSS